MILHLNMCEDKFKKIINKFLERNFPITKVKKNGNKRFRRGIIIESGFTGKPTQKYLISDKDDIKKLFVCLVDILQKVFGVDYEYTKPILTNYLNL